MKKPIISLIAAMAKNRIIGKENKMPWHLPADLAHFKAVTLGKPVIMGRKTYESIGRALPGRKNIIISRDRTYKAEGCESASSLEEALALVDNVEEIMIIGGGHLYSQTIPLADKLYLTFIDLDIDGDTQFPEYKQLNLNEVKREGHAKDEKNPYDCQFVDFVVKRA